MAQHTRTNRGIKISVIYSTARLGGLDMLFESLRGQTMPDKDFELIIIDGWFQQRKDRLADSTRGSSLHIVHVPPKQTSMSYWNSAGFNTGLALAKGELVIFLVDFIWLPEDFLEHHWEFYENHCYQNFSLSVYVDRYKYPPLYDPPELLCIFPWWFDCKRAKEWFTDENLIYQERKGGTLNRQIEGGVFEMPGDKIYMLGDSIPLSVLKELNGWDERYDGGYGSNDLDLGMRVNAVGWKFAVDIAAPTLKKLGDKNTAHLLPTIPTEFIRSPEDNYKILQERVKAINEKRERVAVPDGFGAFR